MKVLLQYEIGNVEDAVNNWEYYTELNHIFSATAWTAYWGLSLEGLTLACHVVLNVSNYLLLHKSKTFVKY